MAFETVAFLHRMLDQILGFFDSKNVSGYSFVTLIGNKVCYITVEKNDTAVFMLCLDLSLSNKGQII